MREAMETWELMKEAFASFDPRIWMALAVGLAVFIFEVMLVVKHDIFYKRKKMLEQAKEAGHCIPAKRVHYSFEDTGGNGKSSEYRHIADYEYSVNGKIRSKRLVMWQEPPMEITLYWLKTPDKVLSEYDRLVSYSIIIAYIIPIAVAYFVLRFLGYNGG